jgi:hypothetical protein
MLHQRLEWKNIQFDPRNARLSRETYSYTPGSDISVMGLSDLVRDGAKIGHI